MVVNLGGGEITYSVKKVGVAIAYQIRHGAYEHVIALDQIITQIMENSQAHPVAATEEIIDKLPREVLEEARELELDLLDG